MTCDGHVCCLTCVLHVSRLTATQAAGYSEAGAKTGCNKWIFPFRDELFHSLISATVKIRKTRLTEPQWKIQNPVMNQQRIRTANTHLLNNNRLSVCSQEIKTPLQEFDFLWKANPPSGERGWNGRRSPSSSTPSFLWGKRKAGIHRYSWAPQPWGSWELEVVETRSSDSQRAAKKKTDFTPIVYVCFPLAGSSSFIVIFVLISSFESEDKGQLCPHVWLRWVKHDFEQRAKPK